MAEPTPEAEYADVPEAVAVPQRRRLLSLIWVVPMLAALVAGWLAVQAILRQGPTITIRFNTAEGLEPGITKLKYRDVEIGVVSALTLSPDRNHVIVTARMQKQATGLLNADTRFWVVRPRISASSVSGLGTLFSGAYIGVDAGTSAESQRDFVGLEVPPVVISGRTGTQYLLNSQTLGSIDIGSPVYYRQVQVGQVVAYELLPDGRGTAIRVFINSPYDRFVKLRSRFWVASGVDATFDASGFKLNTESLVSILIGGIAFRTPDEVLQEAPAKEGAEFELYPDQAAALRQPDAVVQPAMLVFSESVRGLAVGAPLDFRGIQIGEVKSIGVHYDRERRRALIAVSAEVYPERLRRRTSASGSDDPLIETLIRRGLRAQLRQGNLLTGQLYVALDFGPAQPPPDIPAPPGVLRIPTAPSSFTEIQTTLANLAKKLEQLPLDELARDVRTTLTTLKSTLTRTESLLATTERDLAPELKTNLAELRKTLQSAQAALASAQATMEGAQGLFAAEAPVQTDLREMLREVARSAEAVRALAETLERQPEALLRGRSEKK